MIKNTQAIQELRKLFKNVRDHKKLTVWTNVEHVSRSGMSRSISSYIVRDGEILKLDWLICRVLGYTLDAKNGGVKVNGCGMDRGYHIVSGLSHLAFVGTPRAEAYRKSRVGTHSSGEPYQILNHRWL